MMTPTTLEQKLDGATNGQEYKATLMDALDEVASALCVLAHDKGLPMPFQIKFTDLRGWVADLKTNDGESDWTGPNLGMLRSLPGFTLPVMGTLTSADGRTLPKVAIE